VSLSSPRSAMARASIDSNYKPQYVYGWVCRCVYGWVCVSVCDRDLQIKDSALKTFIPMVKPRALPRPLNLALPLATAQ
jgi:hypothetical protein